MAASLRSVLRFRIRDPAALFCPLHQSHRNLCSESDKPVNKLLEPSSDGVASLELKGFLRAQSILESKSDEVQNENQLPKQHEKTFAELLEESPLTRLGDPDGAFVKGKVVKRVQDDIYIDFNGKFCCVCKVPTPSSEKGPSKDAFTSAYQKGKFVVVKLRDCEMTARFMGYDKDMSLLEADAALVGSLKT